MHFSTLVFSILVLCSILSNISCFTISKIRSDRIQWEQHKAKYNLKFTEKEDIKRRSIFLTNVRKIIKLNSQNDGISYKMNHFGHLTGEEFLEYVSNGYKGYSKSLSGDYHYKKSEGNIDDIDWREKGIDTTVYNQGSCGSCWAFSSTGQLESQYALKTGKKVKLSEQDLVDCSKKYGNEGCSGGWMNLSFNYVKNSGINTEQDYPYTARNGVCKHNDAKSILKVDKYVELPPGDEKMLAESVGKVGPVSVAISVPITLQFYFSGIFSSYLCPYLSLNHAVLVVGLGSKPSPYYIIKNSWGSWWGMKGYFLLARDSKNMCGVATAAIYANITI